MMTSTGRHLDETRAGIPNAPSERADLYGQSYCERHQGQLPKGRTQRPDIWAHRSRMRSAKEKRALDRGVVPHMGIPLRHTWLNPSTRPSVLIADFARDLDCKPKRDSPARVPLRP